MSFFDKIKTAIFGDHGPLGGQFGGGAKAATPAAAPAAPRAAPTAAAPAAAAPTAAAPVQPVDVEAILTAKAAARGKPSNWRTSIVDLLQLIDLDSSLSARKELAAELGVHAGADGTAEQNIALHKAVMKKLAQNGGKVPADLQD
jgi:3-oxoacyl-ACP reductase-like protein